MATREEVHPVRGKDSRSPGSLDTSASNGVQKLAALARITIHDSELTKFTKEFDAILEYVGQLERMEVNTSTKGKLPPRRNVMREDDEPTPPGTYTEKLVAAFPEKEGNALSVKQIITHESR